MFSSSGSLKFEIVGDTWTSRYLAKKISAEHPESVVRLWHSKAQKNQYPDLSPTNEFPTFRLVPEFLKSHMTLGFRHEIAQTVLHHSDRKRDLWLDPVTTAKNLGCAPEALNILHELIFDNAYTSEVLVGDSTKQINYDWQNGQPSQKHDTIVFASESSIERTWDNELTQIGVHVHFQKTEFVESTLNNSKQHPALILSPPLGAQDPSNHVIFTDTLQGPPSKWHWQSYHTLLSAEQSASIPSFFIWIDKSTGNDLLNTGLLMDGAVYRCFKAAVPYQEDQFLLQIDRLCHTDHSNSQPLNAIFENSPWPHLRDIAWTKKPHKGFDHYVYLNKKNPNKLLKSIRSSPLSCLNASPTNPNFYEASHTL